VVTKNYPSEWVREMFSVIHVKKMITIWSILMMSSVSFVDHQQLNSLKKTKNSKLILLKEKKGNREVILVITQ
jgi:hypothetical protein